LDDLVELAEGYLEEGQPFRLKLGEVYDRLERPRLEVGRVSIYLVELSRPLGVGPKARRVAFPQSLSGEATRRRRS
jgi:hypothetical protein